MFLCSSCINLFLELNNLISAQFTVRDTRLKQLSSKVPNIIVHSRAKNTKDKYQCYFDQWCRWCSLFPEINPCPTQEQHLILYVAYLFQSGRSFPVIESSVSAIKYFHSLANLNVGASAVLKHLLQATKVLLSYVPKKKQALTVENLRSAINFLNREKTLKNMRTKVIMILSFSAFLRFSECKNLRRSDIRIFPHYAMIFIEKSKTDILRRGHWVFLSRLHSPLCPVTNLEDYFELVKCVPDSDVFIFRNVKTDGKTNGSLRKKDVPVNYSTVREDVRSVLKKIGLKECDYGLHSLRSGGASAAANFGVNDRLIMKHGRWKSVGIKNRYISEDLDSLLFVSRNLGF